MKLAIMLINSMLALAISKNKLYKRRSPSNHRRIEMPHSSSEDEATITEDGTLEMLANNLALDSDDEFLVDDGEPISLDLMFMAFPMDEGTNHSPMQLADYNEHLGNGSDDNGTQSIANLDTSSESFHGGEIQSLDGIGHHSVNSVLRRFQDSQNSNSQSQNSQGDGLIGQDVETSFHRAMMNGRMEESGTDSDGVSSIGSGRMSRDSSNESAPVTTRDMTSTSARPLPTRAPSSRRILSSSI